MPGLSPLMRLLLHMAPPTIVALEAEMGITLRDGGHAASFVVAVAVAVMVACDFVILCAGGGCGSGRGSRGIPVNVGSEEDFPPAATAIVEGRKLAPDDVGGVSGRLSSGLLLLRLRPPRLENVLDNCLFEVMKRRVSERGLVVLERGSGDDKAHVGGTVGGLWEGIKGRVGAGADLRPGRRGGCTMMAGPGAMRCAMLLPWISNPGPNISPAGIPLTPHGFSRNCSHWLVPPWCRFFWKRANRRFHSTRVRSKTHSSSCLLEPPCFHRFCTR